MRSTRQRSSRRAVKQQSNVTSVEQQQGLVLLDLSSLKPIASDRGGAVILNYLKPDVTLEPRWNIPKEILEITRTRKPTDLFSGKTLLRIREMEYTCWIHMVESQSGFLIQPIVGIHLERVRSAADAISAASAKYGLTEREHETVRGVAIGLNNKELAERMNISPHTVKSFLRRITRKMGVKSRCGIVANILRNH